MHLFQRIFHFVDVRYEQLQVFSLKCLRLRNSSLCLKAKIQRFHRGFLTGSIIPNYALVISKEKYSLIVENSATDIYKSLRFINLSF